MKTIYRIENTRGNGPYNDYSVRQHFDTNHNDAVHPTPILGSSYTDTELINKYKSKGIYLYGSAYFFGFNSMDQLNAWFSLNELKVLNEHGYSIVEYKATEYIESKYQVIFIKD